MGSNPTGGTKYNLNFIMEIFGVTIKPGMVIEIKNDDNTNELFIVFPIIGDLAVVGVNTQGWMNFDFFKWEYKSKIVKIYDLSKGNELTNGDILYVKKSDIKISKKEIADRFNINLDVQNLIITDE